METAAYTNLRRAFAQDTHVYIPARAGTYTFALEKCLPKTGTYKGNRTRN
jgi:hypothetical protein